MQMREKVEKVAKHCVFPMICGSLKLARWEIKNCTPLWREARFEVKKNKIVQNTTGPDHFWTLTCRKSGRRWSPKHISKSKCTKHTSGPLLALEMSKKCTRWWHEAHFEVKIDKTTHVRATFGGSDAASRGRRKGLCTSSKVIKTLGFFFKHFQPLHHNTLQHTTLHYKYSTIKYRYTCATFHDTTLHYTTVHSITLHYSTLHSTKLHYIALHYITLHYTPLQLQLHDYTPLHSTTLHDIKLHYTILRYSTY